MTNKFYKTILEKSPWDNSNDDDNIFIKKRKTSLDFNGMNFNFSPKILFLVGALLIFIWLISGVYEVKEGQQSIVIRFGKFDRVGLPGLNYHLPSPIESIIIEKVDESRRTEIGYRSTGRTKIGGDVAARDVNSESIMLTGDENIIELNVDTTWHIKDLAKYTFNSVDPIETVRSSAISAIREVIGNTPINSVLSNQKQAIASKIETLLQQMLDHYDIGVEIEQVKLLRAEPPKEVIAAYRDVQTSKADKEKLINQAEAYKNDVLPRARGEAAEVLQKAEGYQAEIIARAKGDVARFDAIYKQYILNKDVTKNRLYLETVEQIFQGTNKVIMGSDNLLPHMGIDGKSFNSK